MKLCRHEQIICGSTLRSSRSQPYDRARDTPFRPNARSEPFPTESDGGQFGNAHVGEADFLERETPDPSPQLLRRIAQKRCRRPDGPGAHARVASI
jgi:hypothetical protein